MKPTVMLPPLTDTTQTISFDENEDGVPMTGEVYSSNVMVTMTSGGHSHGSSKVKLKSLVDYNWEPKQYSGQLLAVHVSGKYLAYCIKAPNPLNPGTWCGMVRVVYSSGSGGDLRALIKGMKGEVQDLAFAHIQSQVVLACIDEQGNFYVHEIEVTDSGLRHTLIADVREDTGALGAAHRVVWCPYIPDAVDDDDGNDDDVARLLLTTRGNIARMWNMRSICAGAAASGGVSARALLAGGAGCAVGEHNAVVVDAAFSPDGSALATATADGFVMFFQVYLNHEDSPRCIYKWEPHPGKALSCLFFLDNHKTNVSLDVKFWEFAVTGAENNTIIKIWSCKFWTCLQTIVFTPGPGVDNTLGLKAVLDTSATYLILSDFRARSLYVLHMSRNSGEMISYCKSISEFLLPYPVLSFCIVDAEEDQAKCESSCGDPFHRNGSAGDAADSPDDFDREDEIAVGESAEGAALLERLRVRIRLYIVQPKGLQEGLLQYTPPPRPRAGLHELPELSTSDKEPEVPAITSSILQQQSQQLKNLLMRSQTQPGSLIARAESPPLPPLNLMTPDAFSSPGKREEDDPPLSATPDVAGKRTSTAGPVSLEGSVVSAGGGGGGGGGGAECKPTSGGSSPSREVQQIMALSDHGDDHYYKHDLDDEEESTQTPVVEEETSAAVANGDVVCYPADDLFVSPEKATSTPKLTHSNSETSWPQISLAQITEANQRKASSDKVGGQTHNDKERACSEEIRTVVGLSAADKSRLEQLEHKLDKLCDLVSAQSRELCALRTQNANANARDVLDATLHAHAQRTAEAVETALADGWERISRVGEAASARAAAAAGVGAARALEPLAQALKAELAAKLTATDHLLRENVEKLATSKTVMERLSTSIAKSLSDMVRESFRGALFDSVVPVMEKAHAQLFHQINRAFQNGTKEFAANTEAAARSAAERGGAAGGAALRAALDRHAALVAQAQGPQQQQIMAATLKEVAHSVLEKELSWWREQARVAASRAPSPASSVSNPQDRQMQVAQIQSLMSSGDMNSAFQLALSASDLSLVVAACRAADPTRVFGPPCQLRQHVLLSLVQQLAADMTRDTQIKHVYLEEAIMNLDTTNPVTREHLPVVVRELQKQLVAFLGANPSHALKRQFKMLLMATDSLLSTSA